MPIFTHPSLDTTNLVIEIPDRDFDPDVDWNEDLEHDYISIKYINPPYSLLTGPVAAIASDWDEDAYSGLIYTIGDECTDPATGPINDKNFLKCLSRLVDHLNDHPLEVAYAMPDGTSDYDIGDTIPNLGTVSDMQYDHSIGYSYLVDGIWRVLA